MISVRKSSDRGHFNHGWLDTYHTFSFGHYYDPNHMSFRSLRVINEDVVAPGMGFPQHPHDNMEIITYILSGALAHKDTTGGASTIKPGDVQHMTAGSGIEHSEYNPSKTEPVHLLQIWLKPEARNLEPRYDEAHFTEASRRDQLRLVAAREPKDGAIKIHQDVNLYASLLGGGKQVTHSLSPGRHAWLQIARGQVTVNGQTLSAGDGAAVSEEPRLTIQADRDAEFLLFDLA
ncbi:MAG TPA: pirin family protein [Phycisphaerales bacterium]|nr:pirin family protein [Phycisphaerales bacterium]